jgi:5-methylcytosine-specific restriction protein A
MSKHRSLDAQRYHALYNRSQWKRLRKAKLQRNPCCERCLKLGYVELATVVHHKVAHRGNEQLFLDIDNLEALCKPHHDGEAQSEEKQGYSRAVDNNGWPLDARHPMNKYDEKKK